MVDSWVGWAVVNEACFAAGSVADSLSAGSSPPEPPTSKPGPLLRQDHEEVPPLACHLAASAHSQMLGLHYI